MSLLGDTYGSGERAFNFNAETLRELFFYISVRAMGIRCNMVLLQP